VDGIDVRQQLGKPLCDGGALLSVQSRVDPVGHGLGLPLGFHASTAERPRSVRVPGAAARASTRCQARSCRANARVWKIGSIIPMASAARQSRVSANATETATIRWVRL